MSSTTQIGNSLAAAVSYGIISANTQNTALAKLDDIALSGCMGVNADEIDSEDVSLLHICIDASGSMLNQRQQVIDEYNNRLLAPLKASRDRDKILIALSTFSGNGVSLIHSYAPASKCNELDKNDYLPSGSTPLYDAVYNGLIGIAAYGSYLRNNGTRVKSFFVVISDGGENASINATQGQTKNLSTDLIKAQEFVLAFSYLSSPADAATVEQLSNQYADELGFPSEHRLTTSLDSSGIRNLFGTVSASVISASKSTVSSSAISSNPFFNVVR